MGNRNNGTVPSNEIDMEARVADCPAQSVLIDGRKIVYHVEGPENAPAVVLLHGMGSTRKQWILPDPPTNVRVVAITRAGYDDSDDVDYDAYTYETLVGDIREVVDTLGVDRFHVMGRSARRSNFWIL